MLISSAFFFFTVVLKASLHEAGLSRNTIIPNALAVSLSDTQRVLEESCGAFCTPLGSRGTLWLHRWVNGVDADSNAAYSN